ncbi:MAG TPA: hypothetical protein DIW47_15505 [Bacteroidetes bacterium]|nr:hypothetical protein [Bacteroidota bacterium]
MKGYLAFFSALFVLLFTSCEKEEDPYKLPAPGSSVVQQVNMGSDYSKVIFYDLNKETFTIEELGFWDIALESSASGYRALINGGAGTQIAGMGDTTFNQIYNVDLAKWRWDPTTFNVDSSAIGDWADPNFILSREVYLMDRSINNKGEQYKKFQLIEVSNEHYLIRTANLDGSNDQVIRVEKDPTTSYVYAHLDNGGLSKYEPAKEEWDFMFTRYRYVYYDMNPVVPYEVNGVILNPNGVVAADTRMDYDSLDLQAAMKLDFTERRDYIGFDWKYYDFDKEAYITDIKRIIVIRSHSGLYYKLRFIDFYDEDGVKGAPTFEFQRL